MSFESWQAFWHMGGHGLYVWLCYGVGFLVILGVGLAPRWQRRRVIRQLRQQMKRQSIAQQSGVVSVQNTEVDK